MARKKFLEYYLGLDIGTNSVGYAVTDIEYNVLKFNGKSMWGVRLFDEAKTAAERRVFRSSKRRLERRKNRLSMLESIFAKEISKIDMGFFQRLKDSQFYIEDKEEYQKNSIFNDENYTDADYHRDFPTIYHLINRIVMDPSPVDVRLLFLALSNVIKFRGHFLFEGQKFDTEGSFETQFNNLKQVLFDELDIELNGDLEKFKNLLTNNELGVMKKSTEIDKIFAFKTKEEKEISKLLAGRKGNLLNLFPSEANEDWEIKDIQFSDGQYDEKIEKIELQLPDKILVIELLKKIYDWAVLAELLKQADEGPDGKRYLSSAKINIYNEHKEDLAALKRVIKKLIKDKKLENSAYDEIFRITEDSKKGKLTNYAAYAGSTLVNNKKSEPDKKVNQEIFCDFLRKNYIKEGLSEDEEFLKIYKKIADKSFLPKQTSASNSVIPYQLKLIELEEMIKNAENYLPFLKEKDKEGISNSDKIKMIMTYRIPYYIGPVNPAHRDGIKSWVVRKGEPTKVTPWNFEKVIDIEKTAEEFITTRTNKCTYLLKEDVLPKESLLYSEFMVLNELNNLKINGILIDTRIKNLIIEELFKTKKKVTMRDVTSLLVTNGIMEKGTPLSGVNGDFKASLKSYLDFKAIFGDEIEKESVRNMVEEIIRYLVLFGDEKKLTKKRIVEEYGKEIEGKVDSILKLKYKDWGRLSRKFLTEILHLDKSTGEIISIISMMRNESLNLMELLSLQYTFLDAINEENSGEHEYDKLTYDIVNGLYLSPSVKRMLWQSLTIVDELRKIIGDNPKKVFIEMARGKEDKPQRKDSRKKVLQDIYKSLGNEYDSLKGEIEKTEDRKFRSEKLFLYYTQLGRCMYSGEPIDLSKLLTSNTYDIDHIVPKSKIYDDGIDNKVLVKRNLNQDIKKDQYPIPSSLRQEKFWHDLNRIKLLSETKLQKLMRTTELTNDELAGFIARQIVETRQATKATADVLKKVFESDIKKKDSENLTKTEVVYVKAGNVSDFRQRFDIVKVRELNDLHHVSDAYLNVIVGNVFHTKFTSNPWNFMKERNSRSYNIQNIYKYEVKRGDVLAWNPENTIIKVKENLKNNNIQVTRYSFVNNSGFFDQNLVKKGKAKVPMKNDTRFANLEKYGGYSGVSNSFMVLFETEKKGKKVRYIEFIPTYIVYGEINEELVEERVSSYLKELYEVDELKILLGKIKYNSTILINDFIYTLSGNSVDKFIVKPFVQPIFNESIVNYIKKLTNFKNKTTLDSKLKVDVLRDKISIEENLVLYNYLLTKLKNTIYKNRTNNQIKTIEDKVQFFTNLDVEEQIIVLLEILKLLQHTSETANLSSIGGAGQAGRILINKEISKCNQFILINKSPTGLFEQRIDLLKL